MKVYCPDCRAQVPAASMNLESGWAKCNQCQDLFPLSDVVPGFVTAASHSTPVERPFDARATLERSRDELTIHVPPEGLRAGTWGLLGFSLFWLGFIGFWTAGALGLFAAQPVQPLNVGFASFSVPFWIVGFFMLGSVAWNAFGTRSVQMDQNGMEATQRCLFWSRQRYVELDRVQHSRPYVPIVQSNNTPSPLAVEIVYQTGSFVLPVNSVEEGEWLMDAINGFVEAARG